MRIRLVHVASVIALATLAASVTGVVVTYRVAGEELRDVLDDDLEQQAGILARVLASDAVALTDAGLARLLRRSFEVDDEDTLWVTVHDLDSGAVASNQAPALPLARRSSETVELEFDGHAWSGYQHREQHIVVQLLRRDDLYGDVEEEILEHITAPALAGSAVTLLLLAGFVAGLLLPLSRLARQLASRGADSLVPVDVRTPLAEVQSVVDTLNGLMAGVGTVLRRERQFASDVAHELRTPLTTLKVELADPEPDLSALRGEVDRLARLVEQLLTLARLEAGQWSRAFPAVDLASVWAAEAGRLARVLADAGITLATSIESTMVRGEPALLQALLGNLAGNVARHCPPGTRLEIVIGRDGKGPRLTVTDDGPGIPAALREGMNTAFTRLDSRSGGLGLGLAICRRIAEVHGATLAFLPRADGATGLRVEVTFPP